MAIKKIIGRDVSLSTSNFSEIMIIHTDARKMELGRSISSKWEFYYRSLTQINPT